MRVHQAADLALFLDAMVDHDAARQVGWDFDAPFNFPSGASCYRCKPAPCNQSLCPIISKPASCTLRLRLLDELV